MIRKRNTLPRFAAGLVAAVLALAVFQKGIRIAYHKNRLFSAERYALMHDSEGPRPNSLERLVLRLGRGRDNQEVELERMKQHAHSLTELGYLVLEEFPLHHRLYEGAGRVVLFGQITNDFGWKTTDGDWWDMSGTQSNKIAVLTTKEQMPRWKKLVEDFDHP